MYVKYAGIWCETWTMEKHRHRIEAFEMWLQRRMGRLKWNDKANQWGSSNKRKGEQNTFKNNPKRNGNWVPHILREQTFLEKTINDYFWEHGEGGKRR